MHYHLEVIMPPTGDIQKSLESILAPFDEGDKEQSSTFWDWWVIGGRWAGAKREASFPQDKLDAFRQWLTDEGVTVSGIQCGKQEISPASQIPKVDTKWREMFGITGPCTLFRHSNTEGDALEGDVCKLGEVANVTASRVIIAGPAYGGGVEACFMVEQEHWNGVTHIKTVWDGTLNSALAMWKDRSASYKNEWIEAHTPTDEWLVVTVDYHS